MGPRSRGVVASMASPSTPAVAAQHKVLSRQLSELATLRRDMQALYDASQTELHACREREAAALREVGLEREKREAAEAAARAQCAAVAAENEGLRQWNVQLSEDLGVVWAQLQRMERAAADGTLGEADDSSVAEAERLKLLGAGARVPAGKGASKEAYLLQQLQLEACAAGVKLTHAQARLKRKSREVRKANERAAQLQQTAEALSTDLSAATSQIGKLEERIKDYAEVSHRLEAAEGEIEASRGALARAEAAARRAEDERDALRHGPLAEAEARFAECEERERRSHGVMERKVRQAAELAAAVRTLGDDSKGRIEENVRLRLLAQRL